MDKVKVSIVCLTYNHERYLTQALDGFLMQKTTFPFEVIIHDDASTDKTINIIELYAEKYPDIVKPIYQKENQYSKGIDILKNHVAPCIKGEYVALCEGDDFWIDEEKLQKQVEYMESNKDCTLCVHAAKNAYENGVLRRDDFRANIGNKVFSVDEIITDWLFATSSILYRKEYYPEFCVPFQKGPVYDYSMMVFLALQGKVFYIDDFMSVYRGDSFSSVNRNLSYAEISKRMDSYIDIVNNINEFTNSKYYESCNKFIFSRKLIKLLEIDKFLNLLKNNTFKDLSLKEKVKVVYRYTRKRIRMFPPINKVYQRCKEQEYRSCLNKMSEYKFENLVVLEGKQ